MLSASAVMPFFQGARAEIDLKPALTEKVLDKRLLRDFEGNGQKRLKTAASGLFPERLAKAVLEQAGLDEEKQIAEVTKAVGNVDTDCQSALARILTGRALSMRRLLREGASV